MSARDPKSTPEERRIATAAFRGPLLARYQAWVDGDEFRYLDPREEAVEERLILAELDVKDMLDGRPPRFSDIDREAMSVDAIMGTLEPAPTTKDEREYLGQFDDPDEEKMRNG